MDTGTLHEKTVLFVEGDPDGEINAMPSGNATLDRLSSAKKAMQEVGSALIRLELDSACTSEKLINMNLLMMHVAARESDFETFASEKEDTLVDSSEKALEYDILSCFFDSEVREMSKYVNTLEREIHNAREVISSNKHLGEALWVIEEKLRDAEESVKQSQEQVSELTMQSSKFQRFISSFCGEETSDEDKDADMVEDGDFLNISAKIKMQTSEEQRHILRMLEKSLARELDLEKQLTECTQALDQMKLRLRSSKHECLSMEEEAAAVYARFFEADTASAVLLGISKEMVGKLQVCQLKMNSSLRRESELNVRLENCMKAVQKLEKEETFLQELAKKNSSEALVLKEKVNSLEEQLKASESMLLNANSKEDEIKGLKEKVTVAESRAEKAEAECKSLAEANKELVEELDRLKSSSVPVEKVESLEKQLRESDIQVQQAIASVEASEEKQSMLCSSINDMEVVIENMKKKVSKADARADSAEDKCIILSENNAELTEELIFLRGKLECLEASLQQAEETKLATAKDINVRTKVITDLVLQLAHERERLQKQITLLMKENKALVDKLQASKNSSNSINHEGGKDEKEVLFSENRAPSVDTARVNKGEEVAGTTEVERSPREVLEEELDSDPHESKPDMLETVRTIDASQLSVKHVFYAILIALVTVLAVCLLRGEKCPF